MNNKAEGVSRLIMEINNTVSLNEQIKNVDFQVDILLQIETIAAHAASNTRANIGKLLAKIEELNTKIIDEFISQNNIDFNNLPTKSEGLPSFAYHNNHVEGDGHYGMIRK